MEIDLAEDGDGYMARSDIGESNNMIVDFEEAMPFSRGHQRNPTFKGTAIRASSEFLCRLSLKNSDSSKKFPELTKDLEELKPPSSLSPQEIHPNIEFEQSSALCPKCSSCSSFLCTLF